MEKQEAWDSNPSLKPTFQDNMPSQQLSDSIDGDSAATETALDLKETSHNDTSNKGDNDDDEGQYINGFKLIVAVVSVTLVAFLILLDASIIATAIPRITNQFHSIPDIGWYGSAYLLANCSLQPLTGKLYTYFPSKWVFLSFLALFELGSLLCGVAVSSNMLIVGRAVAGMGGSGLVNGALTIITAAVPMEKRPALLGICISVAQLGSICGPLIGGALTQYTTWRWCFYVNLPAGGVAAALISFVHIPDRVKKGKDAETLRMIFPKLDLPGFFIFAPAIIMLLLALEWGGSTYVWNSATLIGLLVGSVAVMAIFFGWEYRVGDNAMVPFSIIKNRIMWSSCLVTFFMMASLLVTTYYLPIWFQVVKDATPTISGVNLLPMILAQIVFATISGVLVGKLGYYLPWIIASATLQVISAGLFITLTPTTSTATWAGFQILAGIGRGMGMQMAYVAVQNALPIAVVPVATAIVIFCQYFGGALFISVAQTIFSNGLRRALEVDVAPGGGVSSVDAVIAAGATGFRGVVEEGSVAGVIRAYNGGIRDTWVLSTGLCGAMLVFSLFMGWRSVKKGKGKGKGGGRAAAEEV